MQLSFKSLSKTYDGQPALDGISGHVCGQLIGLLGPNGAGKTTLMRICAGLLKPDHGSIKFDDVRPGMRGHGKIELGFVPERGGLFPDLTGLGTVAYSGTLSGLSKQAALLRAHEILDLVGVEEARYRYVDSYSTGLRQRTKIAMALAHDPDLILLDEPTSGLDPGSRREILDLLAALPGAGGPEVILSTHLLNDVESLCDGCIILDQGQLRFSGALDSLEPESSRRCIIRLLNPSSRFIDALKAGGGRVNPDSDGRLLEIELGAEQSVSLILATAAQFDAVVVEAYPAKMPIEERFRRKLNDSGIPDG